MYFILLTEILVPIEYHLLQRTKLPGRDMKLRPPDTSIMLKLIRECWDSSCAFCFKMMASAMLSPSQKSHRLDVHHGIFLVQYLFFPVLRAFAGSSRCI